MSRVIKFRAWDGKKMWGWDDMKGDSLLEIAEIYPERNEHLMQFTGLLDAKGKEIYEGDIVQSAIESLRFGYETISWDRSGGYTFFSDGEYGISPDDVTVIGNIYNNPELMKG